MGWRLLPTALLSALLAAGAAGAADEVDLLGTWHVLVHYKDANTAHPDTWRWEDKIWVFERSGSRLRWTEYPIVVFEDREGRFEALGTNRASRVMHAWEPNAGQLSQIQDGLEVNDRGKRSKTLRRTDDGWRTTTRPTPASASVITYVENWSITGPPGLPVFERVDILGSARTESLDGVTRYTTVEVEPEGRLLRGEFVRDGTRVGRFRMMPSGAAEGVKGSGKTQGERLMEAWFGDYAALMGGDQEALKKEIERRIREGEEVPEEARAAIRAEIREQIEKSVRRSGVDPDDVEEQVESLTGKLERLIVDEGRSLDEIAEMLEKGEIRP